MNTDNVTRKEFIILNFIITSALLATALFTWRVVVRHNENIQNMVKICDKVGIEYYATTNHIGLRNNIILKSNFQTQAN